jgi:hypothetical protein
MVGEGDNAAVSFEKAPRNCEAEAGASGGRSGEAKKLFENIIEMFGRNACAVVADLNCQYARGVRHVYLDAAALCGIETCVV